MQADGRRSQVQHARGGGKRAELGNRHERAQLVEAQFSHANSEKMNVDFRRFNFTNPLTSRNLRSSHGSRQLSASVFIDGDQGTAGLKILERLSGRQDIRLVTLPERLRKDAAARAVAINDCDV